MISFSKSRWLLAIIVLLIFGVGCAGRPVKIESVANQNYDTSRGREVVATAHGFQLLLVIPIRVNSRQARAYQAIRNMAGDNYVITNVRVKEFWRYAFWGTVYGTRIRATLYPKIRHKIQ